MIQFDLPKDKSSIIKVIGVGGGGSNAVNHMYAQHIEGVDFIICNTDAQALATSEVPNKIQLGPSLTRGLGAGANPKIGREATEESLEEIRRILEVNTDMAFITAGMGGGTGTGGAPIIAKICKDLNILTVGIVTTPFSYEGKKRLDYALAGIAELKDSVDTLLVISNDKLRHQFGNLKVKDAFAKADNVLATAAKCITDVINSTGQINVDFADVCTVMRKGGAAFLGNAVAEGENRAQAAIEQALNSPLLNDNEIRGAKWILLNINSADGDHEFTMDEVEIIQSHVIAMAGPDTDVILGLGYDEALGASIGVTLIATGYELRDPIRHPEAHTTVATPASDEKEVFVLQMPSPEPRFSQPSLQFDESAAAATPAVPAPEQAVEVQLQPTVESPESSVVVTEVPAVSEDDVIHFTLDMGEQAPAIPTMPVMEATPVAPVEPVAEVKTEVVLAPVAEIVAEAPVTAPAAEEPAPVMPVMPVMPVEETPVASTPIETNLFAFTVTETSEEDASNPPASFSGGILVKPINLYAEEAKPESKPNTNEMPTPMLESVKEDEPSFELHMEVMEEHPSAGEQAPIVQQTQPFMKPESEEPAMQDEEADARRRAMDRVTKLRSLSFNINAADPNNEFETVPAYLRRKDDLPQHNSIADVESFYTRYQVKQDENNQLNLQSINTFLEGNKPD
jgi:cell division protein FtsZ